MRRNLKQFLKLFFDTRVVGLLLVVFLVGLFMGQFIWLPSSGGPQPPVAPTPPAAPTPPSSLEQVRQLRLEGQEQQQSQAELPQTYTVQPGDSTWQVAEAFYGDPLLYPEIEKANQLAPDSWLEVGQKLVIPQVDQASDKKVDLSSNQPQLEENQYLVMENDTLWYIALKYLDDDRLWPELYELNREKIGPNPDLIYPGQRLQLPPSLVK